MGRQRVLISAEADQVLSPPVMSSEVETSLTSLAMSSQLFALCVRQKLQIAGPTQGLSLTVTPRITMSAKAGTMQEMCCDDNAISWEYTTRAVLNKCVCRRPNSKGWGCDESSGVP